MRNVGVTLKLHADAVAATAHLIKALFVCFKQLHHEIDEVEPTRGHGSEALRGDELEERFERYGRERLKSMFCAGGRE